MGNATALPMRISGQSILAGLFPQNQRNGRDPVELQGLNSGGDEAMIGYSCPHLLVDHKMRNETAAQRHAPRALDRPARRRTP